MDIQTYTLEDTTIEKQVTGSGSEVTIVAPHSDIKKVTPPSVGIVIEMPINPRKAVIYIMGGNMSEETSYAFALKEKAFNEKTVFICPVYADDAVEAAMDVLAWVKTYPKKLNIVKQLPAVMYAAECEAAAKAFVAKAAEAGDTLDDVSELTF